MKLNLELTENKTRSLIPQAERPKDLVGKAPFTKAGKKTKAAPVKVKSSSFKQPGFKNSFKFSKKGKPLSVDAPAAGLPAKTAQYTASKFKQPLVSKQKSVGKMKSPKFNRSMAAIPDSDDVKGRGITNHDAGDPGLSVKAAVSAAVKPTKYLKNIKFAPAKIVKPNLGFGVLEPGKVMDVLGNMNIKMNAVSAPRKINESANDQTIPTGTIIKNFRSAFLSCEKLYLLSIPFKESDKDKITRLNYAGIILDYEVDNFKVVKMFTKLKVAFLIRNVKYTFVLTKKDNYKLYYTTFLENDRVSGKNTTLLYDEQRPYLDVSNISGLNIEQINKDITEFKTHFDAIMSSKSAPSSTPSIEPTTVTNESFVINGSVEIAVAGKVKAVLEAATPKMIAKRALDYASLGARVDISTVYRGRRFYSDRQFASAMVESEHARHHGLPHEQARRAAFNRLRDMLSTERDPRLHDEATWLRTCVKEAMEQATLEFRTAYINTLRSFDAIVVTENKRVRKNAVAVDGRHAAALAADAVLQKDILANIRSVYVEGKKYSNKGKSLFMKFPEPFKAMETPEFFIKSSMGKTAEPKIKAPSVMKIGGSSMPKGVNGLKISSNTKFDVGSERGNLVDRDGSRYKTGKSLSMNDKPQKKINESEQHETRSKLKIISNIDRFVPVRVVFRNHMDQRVPSVEDTHHVGFFVQLQADDDFYHDSSDNVFWDHERQKIITERFNDRNGNIITSVNLLKTDDRLYERVKAEADAAKNDPNHISRDRLRRLGLSITTAPTTPRTPTIAPAAPISEGATQKVMDKITSIRDRMDGDNKRFMDELFDKVKNDEDLTELESQVLDKIIPMALSGNEQ